MGIWLVGVWLLNVAVQCPCDPVASGPIDVVHVVYAVNGACAV